MKKRILSLGLALCFALGLVLCLAPTASAETDAIPIVPTSSVDVGPADVYYTISEKSKNIRMYPASGEDDKQGYIDEQGRWVIPPTYKQTNKFLECGYARVTAQDDKRYIINTEGELFACIGDYELYDTQGGNAIIGRNSCQGVISLSGKVIAPVLDGAECAFELGGKYVTQRYFADPYAYRPRPQMWIFDSTGKDLFPNIYCCDIKVLSSDRMSISVDGNMNAYGYSHTALADFNGKFYPLPKGYEKKYAVVRPFVGDTAQVHYHATKNGGPLARYYFFINKQCKMLTPDRFGAFTSDMAPDGSYYASDTGGNWRKYNAKGKDLGAAPGEMNWNFANGTVVFGPWCNNNRDFRLFNLEGKQISTPPDYETGENMLLGDTSGNIYYSDFRSKKSGLMDPTGKVIIPMAPGYIVRIGDYYRQKTSDPHGPIKIYDLHGKLISEILPYQKIGPLLVSGGRTIYASPDKIPKDVIAPISKVVPVTAAPSQTKLMVNGKAAAINAYTIQQSNYMKLRDLAALLNGTQKQFEVTYDTQKGAINVLTAKPYTPAGGELAKGDGKKKSATTGTAPMYIDGKPMRLKAYDIGGNNFYKLRDVMQTLDVYVGWDGATSSASLDTSRGYIRDEPAPGVYRIHSALEPVKYVDISEGSRKDGAHVITWEKTTDFNQQFVLSKVGNKFRIVAFHSGKAISVDGTPNSQLIQKPVSNDPNQLFTLVRQPSGGYNIKAATGQYLSVAAGSTDNGTAIIVWDKTGSKGQEFFFE